MCAPDRVSRRPRPGPRCGERPGPRRQGREIHGPQGGVEEQHPGQQRQGPGLGEDEVLQGYDLPVPRPPHGYQGPGGDYHHLEEDEIAPVDQKRGDDEDEKTTVKNYDGGSIDYCGRS